MTNEIDYGALAARTAEGFDQIAVHLGDALSEDKQAIQKIVRSINVGSLKFVVRHAQYQAERLSIQLKRCTNEEQREELKQTVFLLLLLRSFLGGLAKEEEDDEY